MIDYEVEGFEDLKDKYFKVLLTPEIVEKMKLPLVNERGVWWLEVNKDKKKDES